MNSQEVACESMHSANVYTFLQFCSIVIVKLL